MKVGAVGAEEPELLTESPSLGTPSAATITVLETLQLLDSKFKAFAEGIAEGLYTPWLGSGISRERFPMLPDLIIRVLEFIRSRANFDGQACDYRRALEEALALAPLTVEERHGIDFKEPVAQWAIAPQLQDRLTTKYGSLLDIEIGTEAQDILIWEGVRVAETYGDTGVEPDVEHLCLAVLILEGMVTELASANWDGLIEKAVDRLAGATNALVACVKSEDLQAIGQQPYLLKFHGCAVRAKEKPAEYRKYIVGRAAQIADWGNGQDVKAVFADLVSTIVKRPSLMLGLSVQDFNIQHLFGAAKENVSWPWPGKRPSYVFSEDVVTAGQKALLQIVYKNDYSGENRKAIQESAHLRAYPKPLLQALVLYGLTEKLRRVALAKPSLTSNVPANWVADGLVALRNSVAAAHSGNHFKFATDLIMEITRTRRLMTIGDATGSKEVYEPLSLTAAGAIAATAEVQASGMPEAAFAAAMLGLGIKDGHWTLTRSPDLPAVAPVAIIKTALREVPLWIASTIAAEQSLYRSGRIKDSEPAILLRGQPEYDRPQRSPSKVQGRGKVAIEVTISQIVAQASSGDDLMAKFRAEAVI